MVNLDTSGPEATAQQTAAGSDRLIFHDSVPELAKLAGFRLTLDLWSSCLQDPSDNLQRTFKTRIDDFLKNEASKISDSNKITITWYSKRILKLSSNWVSYHKEKVFKNWDTELITGMCLPELIWRPDGSIDGVKSAEKLLKNVMLGDEQEYKLACLYCMEKRIVDVWRRLGSDQRVVLDVFFDQEVSLFSYWNSRMSGFFSSSEVRSVKSRLVSNEAIDNLSSAVYFFDRSTNEERVEVGCQLIPCVKLDERAEYVKTILSKFDEKELRRAFQSHCSDIMYPLIMNSMYLKFAFEVWDRVKDRLTIQSFLSIMIRITATIRVAFKNPLRRFVDELDDYADFNRHIFTSIGNLWKNTPEWLKRHRLTSSKRGVTEALAEYYVKMSTHHDPGARFLFIIGCGARGKLRRQFMSKYLVQLSRVYKPRVVNDLINLYLREKDKKKFRFSIINGNIERMVDLFRAKKFAKLEKFLKVYEPVPRRRRLWKRTYILSRVQPDLNFFRFPLVWNDELVEQVREFIADAFENHPQQAAQFQQKFQRYFPRLWPEPPQV